MEVDALPLGRHLDRHDLLEHLDATLDLRGLRRLVAEAVDELRHARDFLVLPALGLPQALHPGVPLDQVVAVAAVIVGEGPEAQVGNPCRHRIEEVAIVRDEDDGVRVGDQVRLEPVAGVEIEVVRRFVEQQQIGLAEEQLGEGDPHLPAARERVHRTLRVVGLEAEAAQHGGDLQVDAVAVVQPEAILQIAVAGEQGVVLTRLDAGIGEPLLDGVHLGLLLEQGLKGEADLFVDRATGVGDAVLRQVADRLGGRLDDAARVGLFEAVQHPQQGRLAGAVRAAQSDALALADLPRHVVQQNPIAEGFRQVCELNHRQGRARPEAERPEPVPDGDPVILASGCPPTGGREARDPAIRRGPWRPPPAPAGRGTAW